MRKGVIVADPDDINVLQEQTREFRELVDETLYLPQVMAALALEPGLAVQFRDMRLRVADILYKISVWKSRKPKAPGTFKYKREDAPMLPVSMGTFNVQLDRLIDEQNLLKMLLVEVRKRWEVVKLMKGEDPWTPRRKF